MADPTSTVTPPAQPSETDLKEAITKVTNDAALSDKGIPLEVKLKTGQVYRGNTPQELLAEMAKAQENSSVRVKELSDEVERLKTQAPAQQQPPDENQWSPQTYFDIWQKDPLQAEEYKAKFDPKARQLEALMGRMQQTSELDNFKANVSFYPSADEAQAFADEFTKARLAPTAANFELVFWRMQNQGKLAPPQAQVKPHQAPPPHIGGGSAPQQGMISEADFARLGSEKQALVLAELKARGYK